MSPIPEGKIGIQFDGMCVLCSRTVRFLLKADRKNKFLFQTLQNSADVNSIETVIVTDHFGRRYDYFDAVLKIGYELGGVYKIVSVFKVLPRSWRKSFYLWIAQNRFRWFGKRKSCYLPEESEKEKFI
jgi:predicted DCC family thiol-disulfide oxidoreductase YuxK